MLRTSSIALVILGCGASLALIGLLILRVAPAKYHELCFVILILAVLILMLIPSL